MKSQDTFYLAASVWLEMTINCFWMLWWNLAYYPLAAVVLIVLPDWSAWMYAAQYWGRWPVW